MTPNKRTLYTVLLVVAFLFSAPVSLEAQVIEQILTTQKSRTLRDGSQDSERAMCSSPPPLSARS